MSARLMPPHRLTKVPIYNPDSGVLWGVACLIIEIGLFAIGQSATPHHDDVKCEGLVRWDAEESQHRLASNASGPTLPHGMVYITDVDVDDGTMTVFVLRVGDFIPKVDYNREKWSSLEEMKVAHHRYWTLAQMRDVALKNGRFLAFVNHASNFKSATEYMDYITSTEGTLELKNLSSFNHNYVGPIYSSCMPHNKKITGPSWITDNRRVRILAVDAEGTVYVTVGVVWKGEHVNIIPASFLFEVTRKVIQAHRITTGCNFDETFVWDRDFGMMS